jgi:mono/diheme cytochrome c family protein
MRGKLSQGRARSTGDLVNHLAKARAAGRAPGADGEILLVRVRWVKFWLVAFAAAALAAPANAQGNIDAGKSPAQIFGDTCAACHKSAGALKRTGAGFLRSHYTTGPVEANAMANYLAGVGSEPRANQQRPTPATDPGQTPASGPNQASRQPQPKAAPTPAGKKGRPGTEPRSTAAILTDARPPEPPETAAPPASPPPVLEPFEE